MRGFADSYHIDADDEDFLSADGKTRKEKRTAKRAANKAEKEAKLRNKKGAEISAAVNESVGGMLGIPTMPTSAPEKKKGLKGMVSNLKDKREKHQADKLFKKDLERGKKEGTLTKYTDPKPDDESHKKKRDLSGIKNTVLGIPSLLGLGNEEKTETPGKKKPDTGKTVQYAILGLGALALVAILFSKGIPGHADKK